MDEAAASVTDPNARQAWESMEKSMSEAPLPNVVAERIVEVVQSEDPPPVMVVGDFKQALLAPFAQRLLPARAMEWFLKQHYSAASEPPPV